MLLPFSDDIYILSPVAYANREVIQYHTLAGGAAQLTSPIVRKVYRLTNLAVRQRHRLSSLHVRIRHRSTNICPPRTPFY